MPKDLIARLNEGPVLCAEGYLFAMERRGYLQAGPFVPEVVLENPEVVTQLHREFIRAGSDVVQAFTYYGHREKLRIIGKEDLLEPLQKNALKIAHEVAKEFSKLIPFPLGRYNSNPPYLYCIDYYLSSLDSISTILLMFLVCIYQVCYLCFFS